MAGEMEREWNFMSEGIEKQVAALIESVKDICHNETELLYHMEQADREREWLKLHALQLEGCLSNLRYELQDPRYENERLFFPNIRPAEEAVEMIVNKGCSMARFGDGEFSIMENVYRHAFQKVDLKLAERLKQIISVDDSRLIIAVADNYGNLERYTDSAAWQIRIYMTEETRKAHMKYLCSEKIYYDAYITRPYVMHRDDKAEKRFLNLKRIWENRDVILVEGSKSRLGVGNDLFDNVKSFRRILAPAVHSFDRYDEILNAALSYAEAGVLFLIALGPSAGVLAYDLTILGGYQAIDIGHVDLEYEWFLAGKKERTIVRNKYNNEVFGGNMVEDTGIQSSYYDEIIADFS